MSKHSHRLTEEQHRSIVAEYAAGRKAKDIAADYGVDVKMVSYLRRKYGQPTVPQSFPRGEDHWNYKTGRITASGGYIYLLLDPDDSLYCMANHKGYAAEHRIVVARNLGRPLTPLESVHHIDGDRQNNDINNLQLRSRSHGYGQALCCADCGSENVVPKELL